MDEPVQRTVAIKIIRPSASHDIQTSRLIDGAWAASQLRHPNIVQVHETGLSEFGPFIVMEDLRGENIGRLLERHGRLKKEHAFAIIEPVLLAFSQAHSIGLLHGAVKPENVIVCQAQDQRVTVKVLDFGGSIAAHAAGGIANAAPGAIEYMAPEQINAGLVDHRADLFSLCVLIYELLTNSLPFHGLTPAATASRITSFPCPTLVQAGLLDAIALSEVLTRGMEKAPALRYPNARELLDALRPLMRGDTSGAVLLSELLPITSILRRSSGTMSIPATSLSSWSRSSSPSPESGARMHGTTIRSSPWPTSSKPIAPPSSGPGAISPGSLAPVLPTRFRGKFHARAVVWQALDEYVRARRPAALREQILYEIGDVVAGDLLLGTLYGFAYCDLDSLTQYIEMATIRLFSGDSAWCRVAGNDSVDGVLSPALSRSIPPNSSIGATLRRVARIVGPFFDFGHWQLDEDESPYRAVISLTDIDAACQGLRLWFAGLIERSMSMTRQRVNVNILRGESSFMPRLTIEVTAD